MNMESPLSMLPAVLQAQDMAASCQTIEELVQAILNYKGHPLAASTRAVPGRAGERAGPCPIMLLGKSPAATETETGLPFQGPAAQVLRNAIKDAGGDIEDFYQTHATYWRPRKDNTPNATQLAFSRPFLLREIELVRPRSIIALGAKALDGLFGIHPDMEEAAGSVVDWNGIPTIITRNQGYVMRFPSSYDAFVETLRMVINQPH